MKKDGITMKAKNTSSVKNIVLLGHTGSGKTSLVETMLYESGTIRRRGSVKDHNTVSDFHPIEVEKLKSVYPSVTHFDWRGTKVNLLDTPGSSDFWGRVPASLFIADSALFVIDSEKGVEVGTEAFWRMAERANLPSFFVVNKLDSSRSDFDAAVDAAKEHFGRGVVVVQFPYSEGDDFHAIIDVLKMRMYEFPENGGKPDKLPIPKSMQARAELYHNELVETIAENDESLLDLYFENGQLGEYEMQSGLHDSMLKREIFPLFCTVADRNMGSGRIMGFMGNVVPGPVDKPLKLSDGGERSISQDHSPSMFVFRSESEAHVGELSYFKVTGGEIHSGLDLIRQGDGDHVRIGSIFVPQGKLRTEVPGLLAGDIGVAVKLKGVHAGATLTSPSDPFECAKIHYPNPTIRVAIETEREGEEDKLSQALSQIQLEDPSVRVEHSQELQQTLLHGMGEEHLRVIQHQMKERFGLDIVSTKPAIPYRETIQKRVEAHYKHKKQSGGAGQFAEVYLSIEPWYEGVPDRDDLNVRNVEEIDLEWGGKLVFQNCIVGGVIDNRFMPAILKGVMEKMQSGPMSGCRAMDIRVSVVDGSMHSVDSNEAAFKTASLMAFKQGFLEASPKLLEPIYNIEITLPGDYTGDVMSDLSTRRGQILGMDSDGTLQKIRALVPLSELDRYTTTLKSLTQGSATYSQEFHEYVAVPFDIQKKVMEETLDNSFM